MSHGYDVHSSTASCLPVYPFTVHKHPYGLLLTHSQVFFAVAELSCVPKVKKWLHNWHTVHC